MKLNGSDFRDLATALIPVVQKAGAAIMNIYNSGIAVRYKDDNSPVTDADHAAEEIIIKALHSLMPGVPVIAEEQTAAGILPDCGDLFFLVDPLDGTRDFIARSGEFTVNIGLVAGVRPRFGIIYAPALADGYVTTAERQAMRFHLAPFEGPSNYRAIEFNMLTGDAPKRVPIALVSRSNQHAETAALLRKMPRTVTRVVGSSLKLCMLARGDADIYARFGTTSEWDTAAGHAILEAAGGQLLTHDNGPFLYGKRALRYVNPCFIAWRCFGEIDSTG